MTFNYLEGWWTDAGTFDSLLKAANLVSETKSKMAAAKVPVSAGVSES